MIIRYSNKIWSGSTLQRSLTRFPTQKLRTEFDEVLCEFLDYLPEISLTFAYQPKLQLWKLLSRPSGLFVNKTALHPLGLPLLHCRNPHPRSSS
jgi:hypothetical protein